MCLRHDIAEFRVRRVMKFLLLLIVLPFALLLSKCTFVHFQHDSRARQLLTGLQSLPLPRDARPLHALSEVGNYYSSTGDATDILAYRAFTTNLPAEDVSAFFAPYLKQLSKHSGTDVGVVRLDERPPLYDTPINLILEHCPQADRGRAYILYSVTRCDEDGLWDIRGW